MSFPTTYCITCKESGRTEAARANFAAAGVPARFIQGVFGKRWALDTRLYAHRNPAGALAAAIEGCKQTIALAESEPEQALDYAYRHIFPACQEGVGYRIDAGHLGLCLSHWMIWQLALDRGCDEVLICEDDCDFVPGFLAKYEQARHELPDDWQLWYVGSLNLDSAKKEMVRKNLCTLPSGYPWGTHCYLVRRSALPILLDKCNEARTHIDSLIAENALSQLHWYVSYPTLAGQHSADGTWPHAVGGFDGTEKPSLSAIRPPPAQDDRAEPAKTNKREAAVQKSQRLDGWCPVEKAHELYDAVLSLSEQFGVPLLAVELGVYRGKSLLPMAFAMRDCANGGKVIGIDPYTAVAATEGLPNDSSNEGQHRRAWAHLNYHTIQADCRQAIYAHRLAEWCELRACMPDDVAHEYDGIHLLHLDDSHSPPVALRNAVTWTPKLLPGALCFVDDIHWVSMGPCRAYLQAELELVGGDMSDGHRWEVYRRRS